MDSPWKQAVSESRSATTLSQSTPNGVVRTPRSPPSDISCHIPPYSAQPLDPEYILTPETDQATACSQRDIIDMIASSESKPKKNKYN